MDHNRAPIATPGQPTPLRGLRPIWQYPDGFPAFMADRTQVGRWRGASSRPETGFGVLDRRPAGLAWRESGVTEATGPAARGVGATPFRHGRGRDGNGMGTGPAYPPPPAGCSPLPAEVEGVQAQQEAGQHLRVQVRRVSRPAPSQPARHPGQAGQRQPAAATVHARGGEVSWRARRTRARQTKSRCSGVTAEENRARRRAGRSNGRWGGRRTRCRRTSTAWEGWSARRGLGRWPAAARFRGQPSPHAAVSTSALTAHAPPDAGRCSGCSTTPAGTPRSR